MLFVLGSKVALFSRIYPVVIGLRDFKKFMERDRHGLESNVLRFVARMDTTRPIDMDRRFTVFFHLSDDTITVFEPPQRNSGQWGSPYQSVELITYVL